MRVLFNEIASNSCVNQCMENFKPSSSSPAEFSFTNFLDYFMSALCMNGILNTCGDMNKNTALYRFLGILGSDKLSNIFTFLRNYIRTESNTLTLDNKKNLVFLISHVNALYKGKTSDDNLLHESDLKFFSTFISFLRRLLDITDIGNLQIKEVIYQAPNNHIRRNPSSLPTVSFGEVRTIGYLAEQSIVLLGDLSKKLRSEKVSVSNETMSTLFGRLGEICLIADEKSKLGVRRRLADETFEIIVKEQTNQNLPWESAGKIYLDKCQPETKHSPRDVRVYFNKLKHSPDNTQLAVNASTVLDKNEMLTTPAVTQGSSTSTFMYNATAESPNYLDPNVTTSGYITTGMGKASSKDSFLSIFGVSTNGTIIIAPTENYESSTLTYDPTTPTTENAYYSYNKGTYNQSTTGISNTNDPNSSLTFFNSETVALPIGITRGLCHGANQFIADKLIERGYSKSALLIAVTNSVATTVTIPLIRSWYFEEDIWDTLLSETTPTTLLWSFSLSALLQQPLGKLNDWIIKRLTNYPKISSAAKTMLPLVPLGELCTGSAASASINWITSAGASFFTYKALNKVYDKCTKSAEKTDVEIPMLPASSDTAYTSLWKDFEKNLKEAEDLFSSLDLIYSFIGDIKRLDTPAFSIGFSDNIINDIQDAQDLLEKDPGNYSKTCEDFIGKLKEIYNETNEENLKKLVSIIKPSLEKFKPEQHGQISKCPTR